MIGQQRYKLPGAKRKKPQPEPESAVEVDEIAVAKEPEIGDVHDEVVDDIGVEYEDDEEYYEQQLDEGDDYYFQEEEEPEKKIVEQKSQAPLLKIDFESNREDIGSLEKLVEVQGKIEEVTTLKEEKDEWEEYHKRDESVPFVSPPGYIWAYETASYVPFGSLRHLINFIGIGDSAEQFNPALAAVEKFAAPEILPLATKPGESADQARLEYVRKAQEIHQEEEEVRSEMEEEDFDEDGGMGTFPVDDLATWEPAESPAGIFFWAGPRWNHWWYGYESPTSITGYPVQWFYRITHLFFPELYYSFVYEKHYGDVSFKSIGRGIWWLATHPCIPTIVLNCGVVVPFIFWHQIRVRSKIVRNRIMTGQTLLKNFEDHIPIMIRRMKLRRTLRRRKRWFRWIAFFTFAFHPNCWDLLGHDISSPTEDWWDKVFLRPFTDEIVTKSDDLQKYINMKPNQHGGLKLPPNVEQYERQKKETSEIKKQLELRRKEIYGSPQEQRSEWKRIAEEEQARRKMDLAQSLSRAQRRPNSPPTPEL